MMVLDGKMGLRNFRKSKHMISIHFLTCHIPIDPCDYDDPIFTLFGCDLSKIQGIYQNAAQKKKDATPHVPHLAVIKGRKYETL